jgi:hypothetical protein
VAHVENEIFYVGDIVKESPLISLPDQESMIGIVAFVDRQMFGAYTPKIKYEDMIGVMWLETGTIEKIPASLLILVQAAKSKQ